MEYIEAYVERKRERLNYMGALTPKNLLWYQSSENENNWGTMEVMAQNIVSCKEKGQIHIGQNKEASLNACSTPHSK